MNAVWHNALKVSLLLGSDMLPFILCTIVGALISPISFFKKNWIYLGWVIFVVIIYVVRVGNISSRYTVLLIPPVIISGLINLELIQIKYNKHKLIYALLGVSGFLSILFNYLVDVPYKKNYMDLLKNTEIYAGNWIRNNTTRDVKVASFDVGAVGYFSEREIIDYWFLVTPDARYGLDDALIRYKPQYLLFKQKQGEPDFRCPDTADCSKIFDHSHEGYRFFEPAPLRVILYELKWNLSDGGVKTFNGFLSPLKPEIYRTNSSGNFSNSVG